MTAPFVGQGFYDLVVDPADRRHLLAATTGGVYVSTDAGASWTRRRSARTWSLSMAPAGGATAEILAACVRRRAPLDRRRHHMERRRAARVRRRAFDRLAVAIAPVGSQRRLCLGRVGWFGASCGAAPPAPGPPSGYRLASRFGQAWYDWFLAVAPDRATQIYCGAIDAHRGDLSGTTWTWTNLTSKSVAGQSIHPDQHAIAFEPGRPDTIYVGNDGGLYRSPDRGITWQHCNNGLVISEFEYLAQNHGSSRWLIGGTQDNGTERWTGPQSWEHIADGDGGDCGVNRTDPQHRLPHLLQHDASSARPTGGDFGTWADILPPVPPGRAACSIRRSSPARPPATPSPSVGMRSTSRATTAPPGRGWRSRRPAAPSALYIPGPDTVYVGTTAGVIYRTTWNGTAWGALTALTTPRAGAYISDLHVNTAGNAHLGDLHQRRRGPGVPLRRRRQRLDRLRAPGCPPIPINAIEVDPANANRVWVAADLGVYQTLDAGASWADFSSSLPNAMRRRSRSSTRTRAYCAPAPATAASGRSRSTAGDPAAVRRAVDRGAGRQRDAALVHLQLARHMARRLDGDAD